MAHDTQDGLQVALAALQPEIRQMLVEDLPVDARSCAEAFADQRWGQLREQVHRVKGTASFCRLEALKAICVRIEDGLVADVPPDAVAMDEFSAQIDQVLAALRA